MADPKLHRRVGTVLHYDPHQWDGQPLILRAEVYRRTARQVHYRHVYADGVHTHGNTWVRNWDRVCDRALQFPKARIEVPNG